ncbi:MAG: hypothetical protein RIR79_887 [Pseudomonadota bacterium]|jgi:putative transcriptional regulator
MKTTRLKIEPHSTTPQGRINYAKVDATTDLEVAQQIAVDAQNAMQDAAQYARQVRKRLGLSQAKFAQCIDVPLETIRNWEQGKRSPTGAAKTLLRMLNNVPELALQAITYSADTARPLQTARS